MEANILHVANTAMTTVACLYRVSTPSQLTDGDIPLQRNACRAFVTTRADWRIVSEYVERGVSGYHKEAAQRDVLSAIRRDAENGLFNILLVYLFDRLGRREDETPVVAEWLAERGVTVWSVVEGPLRMNGQTDRLVNYIRYWQAGSESAATSLRVAEKHRQMVREGIYRGGPPPFGYTLVLSETTEEKDRLRHKLAIHECESNTVRLMYRLATERNIGCYSVASVLNEQGIVTRFGHKWTAPAVVRTLRNPIYKGDYVMGRMINTRGKKMPQNADKWTLSREPLKALAIVDTPTWDYVNAKIDARNTRKTQKHEGAAKTQNDIKPLLLTSLAYCGYCGGRLAAGGKHTRYDCPRRMRRDACTGAYGYSAARTEHIVCAETERLIKQAETTWGLLTAAQREALMKIEKRERSLANEYRKLSGCVADALSHGTDSEEAKALARRMHEAERKLAAMKQACQTLALPTKNASDEWYGTNGQKQKWLRFWVKRVDVSRGRVDIWFNDMVRGSASGVPGWQCV